MASAARKTEADNRTITEMNRLFVTSSCMTGRQKETLFSIIFLAIELNACSTMRMSYPP